MKQSKGLGSWRGVRDRSLLGFPAVTGNLGQMLGFPALTWGALLFQVVVIRRQSMLGFPAVTGTLG